MGNNIKIAKLPSELFYCNKCKGSCWDKTNNAATQAAAKKMFGIIPNLCVNEDNGNYKCPNAK